MKYASKSIAMTVLWITLVAGSGRAADKIAFRNIDVFDGAKIVRGIQVVTEDGIIKAVGRDVQPPAGAIVIDGKGAMLLPGFIDCHTHTFVREMLEQALQFGVTTELDMFSDVRFAASMRQEQSAGKANDRADLYSASTLVTAKGGHGTQFGLAIPTIATSDEARKFVDARITEGSDYIKIVYEDGKTIGRKLPTIDKATLAAVIAATHDRQKLAVVHVTSREFARDAIAAGADGLVHLFLDDRIDEPLVELMVRKHAFVIPTLTVMESCGGIASGKSLVADPELRPYISTTAAQGLESSFPRQASWPADYAVAKDALGRLFAAGVPVLAGTDAPNPGTSHGASIHRELELLVDAGLKPAQALAAATAVPADCFHLPDRGRIAPSFRADLLLVQGDPTIDIKATRKIVGVWKNGRRLDRDPYRERIEREREQVARLRQQPPPQGSENGLVSDFEEPGTSLKVAFGTGWQESTDRLRGGKSTVTLKAVSGGARQSKGSLEVSGTVNEESPRWAGVIFYPGKAAMTPANLSSKKAISFWAKGDGKTYSIMIFAQKKGYVPAEEQFKAGPEWKKFRFDIKDFAGCDGSDVMGLFFGGSAQAGAFSFQLDDVRFEDSGGK
jgi:imidazolonepropionase-like amidohydrolase